MALVSVIIPYYKKKKYIWSSIKSVLNQTYKKFEIIIIYDDEEKKDLSLIKKIKKKDKRIKLIVNKKNLGAGESRNKGIRLSKGKYIAFIDSDDLWNKNKLKEQINIMEKKNIKISHTSYNLINNNNEIIDNREADYLNFKNLLYSCDIGLSTVILRKNLIRKNIKFGKTKTKEDYILWLKITKKNIIFYPIKKYLTKWRKLSDSLSSSILQKLIDGFKVYYFYMKFNVFKSLFFLLLLSVNYLKKGNKFKTY
tara:strand:- start:1953 stop:2711 length:759 start_codon:yes stop_codon:yes gene_type:complete